jgi:predicted Rossmann-fold nucleotide-binding protein
MQCVHLPTVSTGLLDAPTDPDSPALDPQQLTSLADAFVVLGGRLGTLLEMALVWNLNLMQVYPTSQSSCLGARKATVDCFNQHLLIRDIDLVAFTFADTPLDVVGALQGRLH